jgi:hypothetical protein
MSKGQNQLLGSSVRKAVKIGPERVKLKKYIVTSRCKGTAGDDIQTKQTPWF